MCGDPGSACVCLFLAQVGSPPRLVEQALRVVAAERILDDRVIGPSGVARFGARTRNELLVELDSDGAARLP